MPKSPLPWEIGICVSPHRMFYGIMPEQSGVCCDIGTPASDRNPHARLANVEAEASPQKRSL